MIEKKESRILNLLFGMQNPVMILPGVALAVLITLVGFQSTKWIALVLDLEKSPISAIMMAILLGVLVKNTIGVHRDLQPGVSFGLKKLLRLGIILMGIRLSIFEVLKIGALSTVIIIVCIASGIFLVLFVTKKLALPERLGILIGVGTGICGASAIVATGPAIKAKEEEIAYAVGIITIFGIAAMFFYPYLSHLVLSLSHVESGIFMGTSIHETAQVAGAGIMYDHLWIGADSTINPTGADVAIVTKLVRNAFLAVVIPLMAYIYIRRKKEESKKTISVFSLFPAFILGFIALAVFRSVGDFAIVNKNLLWNSEGWSFFCSLIKQWAGYFLAVAMAGVGLGTDIKKLKQLGVKPFLAGLCAALSVGIMSFVLIKIFASFLAAI
ncbi:MAG: putative sulfate exporter family transporter [Candidatus Aminicenantes bacterium]|nr:MAG: putative sulfate exporter family transporter [Candidatus Aminicenantes bacterium]